MPTQRCCAGEVQQQRRRPARRRRRARTGRCCPGSCGCRGRRCRAGSRRSCRRRRLRPPALAERVEPARRGRRWRAGRSGRAGRRGRCPGRRRLAAACASRGSNRLARMKSRAAPPAAGGSVVPAGRKGGEHGRERVVQVVVDQVQQLRRRLLGPHVHRRAVQDTVRIAQLQLEVRRAGVTLAAAVEDARNEDAIGGEWHRETSGMSFEYARRYAPERPLPSGAAGACGVRRGPARGCPPRRSPPS